MSKDMDVNLQIKTEASDVNVCNDEIDDEMMKNVVIALLYFLTRIGFADIFNIANLVKPS